MHLLEAGPRIAADAGAGAFGLRTRALTRMGVRGQDIDAGDAMRSPRRRLKARIDAGTVIWAAGVQRRRPRAGSAPKPIAPGVSSSVRTGVARPPGIFVIGDTASVRDAAGRMAPGVAPAAKQMGAMPAS